MILKVIHDTYNYVQNLDDYRKMMQDMVDGWKG